MKVEWLRHATEATADDYAIRKYPASPRLAAPLLLYQNRAHRASFAQSHSRDRHQLDNDLGLDGIGGPLSDGTPLAQRRAVALAWLGGSALVHQRSGLCALVLASGWGRSDRAPPAQAVRKP